MRLFRFTEKWIALTITLAIAAIVALFWFLYDQSGVKKPVETKVAATKAVGKVVEEAAHVGAAVSDTAKNAAAKAASGVVIAGAAVGAAGAAVGKAVEAGADQAKSTLDAAAQKAVESVHTLKAPALSAPSSTALVDATQDKTRHDLTLSPPPKHDATGTANAVVPSGDTLLHRAASAVDKHIAPLKPKASSIELKAAAIKPKTTTSAAKTAPIREAGTTDVVPSAQEMRARMAAREDRARAAIAAHLPGHPTAAPATPVVVPPAHHPAVTPKHTHTPKSVPTAVSAPAKSQAPSLTGRDWMPDQATIPDASQSAPGSELSIVGKATHGISSGIDKAKHGIENVKERLTPH